MGSTAWSQQHVEVRQLFNASVPFIAGCGAGMIATISIQPIDTVKVRMQLREHGKVKPSFFLIAKNMISQEGVISLYNGLTAGLLRQVVYGTMRMGLFATFEQALERRARRQGTELGFGGRALAGLGAGALAGLIGNPTEVALIRMQADGMKPLEHRQNYTSAFSALHRIAKQEGILSLWKGSTPTVIRAMSTNFGQLAFFSESKHQIRKYTSFSSKTQTALAAGVAGLAGAVVSLPFDFVKTRLQNQSMAAPTTGLPLYKGTVDCFAKVFSMEGPFRFYHDFWPYLMRVAPHS